MSVWGVMPNINANEAASVKSAHKSVSSTQNNSGPSFTESISNVARSANMQIAHGNDAASLHFTRKKEECFDEPFSFLEAEEEMLEDSVDRITQLLNDLKNR